MPRRPLFCPICADLLNELAGAADAVVARTWHVSEAAGEAPTSLRYVELYRLMRHHLDSEHTSDFGKQGKSPHRCDSGLVTK